MPDNPDRDRPDNACLLHHPPRDGHPWTLPDPGYRTCTGCLDRLRRTLTDIRDRWTRLDPHPANSPNLDGRAAPGFGSRSPASDHVITMRDPRSKSCEVARDGLVYDWDPHHQHPLPAGVHGPLEAPGAYVNKREVWYGSDGRPHTEQERPPLSVPATIAGLCFLVAEDRNLRPPTGPVDALCRWLDTHLDHITRQTWVVDVAEPLAQLHAQLRAVHERRRLIGRCPTLVGEGDNLRECSANLDAPTEISWDDTIRCRACGREWTRNEWLRLADILEAS